MTKEEKLIQEIIAEVTVSVTNLSNAKLAAAFTLHRAKNVIVWKLTKYRGWKGFCRTHVKMNISTVYSYTAVVNAIEKFGYTKIQCKEILAAISWKDFRFGLLDMTRKLSVKTFIKRYKDFTSKNPAKGEGAEGGDRAYTFSLPEKEADMFDLHLVNYGMSFHPKGRRGVRDAMIKLVNKKLK